MMSWERKLGIFSKRQIDLDVGIKPHELGDGVSHVETSEPPGDQYLEFAAGIAVEIRDCRFLCPDFIKDANEKNHGSRGRSS